MPPGASCFSWLMKKVFKLILHLLRGKKRRKKLFGRWVSQLYSPASFANLVKLLVTFKILQRRRTRKTLGLPWENIWGLAAE